MQEQSQIEVMTRSRMGPLEWGNDMESECRSPEMRISGSREVQC